VSMGTALTNDIESAPTGDVLLLQSSQPEEPAEDHCEAGKEVI
jgi:hypothetical protein